MTALGIILRPFVAFVLFFTAALIGRAILRRIPEGRVRRFLGWRLNVVPEPGQYWNFWPAFWLLLASMIILTGLWFADPLRH